MFGWRRRRMNRQAQEQEEQDDFEFCTCDVCMRELRRTAEKEALEAAAKQQLMVSLFDPVSHLYLIYFHLPARCLPLGWMGCGELGQGLH